MELRTRHDRNAVTIGAEPHWDFIANNTDKESIL